MTKKAILVLGMHRSGTSALTGALAQLGVAMPKTEMAATAENPKGYFESHAIMSVNDEILGSCQSAWDDWRSFPADKARSDAGRQIAAVVTDEYGDADIIAIKDPRICKLADLWLPVLSEQGYDCSVILPYRHPAEVAKSLEARQIPEALALLLWLRHVLDAEVKTRGFRRVFLYTPDLMTDWRGTLSAIGRGLDLKWPRTVAKASHDLEGFLDKKLIHHFAAFDLFDSQSNLGGWIKTAFMALEAMKQDSHSSAQQLILDKVRAELDNAGLLFGPAIADVTAEVEKTKAMQIEELERAKQDAQAREERIGQLANEKDVLASHNRDLHYENLYLREAVNDMEKTALQMGERHAQEIARVAELHAAEIQRAHVQLADQAGAITLLSKELAQIRVTSAGQVDALRKAQIIETSRMEGEAASAAAANKAFISALQAEREALQQAQAEAAALHEQSRSSLTQRSEALVAEIERLKTDFDRQLKEQREAAEARIAELRYSLETEKAAFDMALSQMRSEHEAREAAIADMQSAHAAERLSDREQWMVVFNRQKEELAALREAQRAEQALWAVKSDENQRAAQDEKRSAEAKLTELSARLSELETENAHQAHIVAIYRKAKPGDFLKWAAQAGSRP